jgi:hypothetical protein
MLHFALSPKSRLLHLHNPTSSIAAGAAGLCQLLTQRHFETQEMLLRRWHIQPA